MNSSCKQVQVPCIEVTQPIGTFYMASISHDVLRQITYADVRRIEESEKRDVDTYLGIQRTLSFSRVKELKDYVTHVDACFPTGVILAVDGRCAKYEPSTRILTLQEYIPESGTEQAIDFGMIANILDGQHRLAGLQDLPESVKFELNVCIFVELDIAAQAYIFSTVNLAQTKVNKSLVYDLFDLANSRSPQKLSHNVAVALDRMKESPFYHRIKRLGSATQGRENEKITQAAFVHSLLPYLTDNENRDRDLYMRKKKLLRTDHDSSRTLIFRNLMLDERDVELTEIIYNFFSAVRNKWPQSWDAIEQGQMLNKTNGFKALMRFLKNAYLFLDKPVPTIDDFKQVFDRITLPDMSFDVNTYKPGTSGESELYRALVREADLPKDRKQPLLF